VQRWRWMACTAMYSPACWWLPRLLVVLLSGYHGGEGSSGHVRFLHEYFSQQNLMKMISPSAPCLMKRSSVSEWSDQSWRPQSGAGANENASIKERQS
jgi:hypothetical protein